MSEEGSQLKLDYDDDNGFPWYFPLRLHQIEDILGIKVVEGKVFRSKGRHIHARLWLDKRLPALMVSALQAILGSDPVRERDVSDTFPIIVCMGGKMPTSLNLLSSIYTIFAGLWLVSGIGICCLTRISGMRN